jgi:pimeloyl-ACP methyl ester carboxylesterase
MQADYRVIALDSRGHGDSGWGGSGKYHFESYVSDIKALAEHLKLENFDLVGHSAGGRYAWAYAVDNPESVKSIVVVDIDPDPVNPQTNLDFEAYRAEPAVWDSVDAVMEKLRLRQPLTSEEILEFQVEQLTRPRGDKGRVWKADPLVMDEYERPDVWDSWGRITTPTLILRGRQSTLLTHDTAVKMREVHATSLVKLAELEGGGHWFYQDFPGAFEASVRWFFDGQRDGE